jgi:hypothetical protein
MEIVVHGFTTSAIQMEVNEQFHALTALAAGREFSVLICVES